MTKGKIERKPALAPGHPLAGLATQPEEEPPATASAPEQTVQQAPVQQAPAATPAPTPAPAAPTGAEVPAEPYAGSTQFNVRASLTMREHLRVAAAGMTLATGEKWSQDRLVRHAVAAYLAQIADEYNNGRPFHER